MLRDTTLIWRCRNARFTFEGAVDVCASVAFHGPRLLFDSDELSITLAAQGQRDATILSVGEAINLMDADGTASKVSAGTRRAVPEGAKVAMSVGCQPARARDYVSAWDPLNVGARYFIYCAGEKDVLKTTYGQLHAKRGETTKLFDDKLQAQCECFFGDRLAGGDGVAAPQVRGAYYFVSLV